jgi:uncharacterized UPF0160 family protein
MSLFKSKIKVVTHDGNFHADDIFASAAFSLWAEKNDKKLEIIRTREKDKIEKADIVIDMGGIYDSDRNRFDHHQKGGAGMRDNGVPYASFGLVWEKYGEEICGNRGVAYRVEEKLVMPIDARDNGVNISVANKLGINDHHTTYMICNFSPTCQEDKESLFGQFEKGLHFAEEILIREIAWAKALIDGEKETLEAIKKQNKPEILILDKKIEWHEAVSKDKNIKLVVYPNKEKTEWRIQVGRDDLEDYDSRRIKFPESWCGLRDHEFVKVSGIKDAVFCANNGWLAVIKTKEGAIEMANKVLQITQN